MKSCLYVGHIQHRRHAPRTNHFRYRIYMTLLDLDELPTLFDRFWLWSAKRPALAWFHRRDFHGDANRSLAEAVRDTVAQHTGTRPTGPIRLLTHLRYFGFNFNPVSFYYVYDATDTHVETILAEITNTPWKQRHCYVLSTSIAAASLIPSPRANGERARVRGDASAPPVEVVVENSEHPHPALSLEGEGITHPEAIKHWHWQFDKRFHVSPFMPMDMQYNWRFSAPDQALRVHMENYRDGRKEFDATLTLQRQEITAASLARALLSFPLITLLVITLIHWQALKLFIKRVPVHTHPDKINRKILAASGKQA
jgi:hypothetical protein